MNLFLKGQVVSKLKLVVLNKAKYIKRWKGKDGKWKYAYTDTAGKQGAGEGDTLKFIPAPQFNAHEWATARHPDVTTQDVIKEIKDPKVLKKLMETEEKLKHVTQTIDKYKVGGKGASATYTPERTAIHDKIINSILSDEKIAKCKGDPPVLTVLGGRGGSGKSWFKNNEYDPADSLVLDADEIKGMLPEYQGWNAFEVHEESSDILEKITVIAKELKLNTVIDATMKSTDKAMAKVKSFTDHGYEMECHYMHVAPETSAKRAVYRFAGPTGRYVPIDVILANTTNEYTFDQVKQFAKRWTFRDNSGDPPPKLISKSGVMKSMLKAEQEPKKQKKQRGYDPNKDMYDFGDVVSPDKYAEDVKAFIKKKSKNEAVN